MTEYHPDHASAWAERLGPPDVRAAAERIAGRVVHTPTLRVPRLDALADGPVELFLKAENMQRIGAFKARGAMHAVGRLDAKTLARGVVTFSSGNHAQAVALAARAFGVPATIAMPIDAPKVKLEVVRELGAKVVIAGYTSEERRVVAYELAAESGAAIIQPFDHPDIVCGQGTATAELLDAAAALGVELDAILVPVGGGGVLAGACLAARDTSTRIYSVEPRGCDALAASLEAGDRVAVEPGPTLADGLKPVRVGALNFEIARRDVHGSFRVDDDELGRALVSVLVRAKTLVEPSGAAGVAAALREAPRLRAQLGLPEGEERPIRIGVILTGGNVDPALVAELIGAWGGRA
ncbi:L-threonine dehydratase catabolic TdcB [Enhygromyxa salina]|uniref:L-threonine dehydratase catabolic TdcB n=1 Tax=Enhygromyxa salina TaxID=215803 RepID=A0A2S9Y082_9BACT|nr:pyridoxal-phosphate dependent enzyme [Enhygromyxa salina]PRP98499.1 L-threonine dehydratase catabolic TdcB [Enhygromyxa salina]